MFSYKVLNYEACTHHSKTLTTYQQAVRHCYDRICCTYHNLSAGGAALLRQNGGRSSLGPMASIRLLLENLHLQNLV